jgi:hypothetical protein
LLFWRDVLLIIGLAFLSEGVYTFYIIFREILLGWFEK